MIPKEILKKVEQIEIQTRGMVNDVFSAFEDEPENDVSIFRLCFYSEPVSRVHSVVQEIKEFLRGVGFSPRKCKMT